MGSWQSYLLLCCVILHFAITMSSEITHTNIPKDVLLGYASASYQIEGAWNEGGKGEHIWDRFIHSHPSRIADGSSGDVAADSYHKYKEDVQLVKKLNGQVYRFSISWSRILPEGFANNVNLEGVEYYNNIIDELIRNKIEPVVTLFHWDLPQPLQDIGGWPNERLADYFEDYARLCFTLFGDRVKKWITINEPTETALLGYGSGIFAPGIESATAPYLAGHTILKAHARAYHIYQDEFKKEQQGIVGICYNTVWFEPKTSDDEDVRAARERHQFYIGWMAHPIFSSTGDYPEEMKVAIADNSEREGYPQSRLPELDSYWISYIKGTSDFFGVNHYTSFLVSRMNRTNESPSWEKDTASATFQDPSWPKTASSWFRVVPTSFRKALANIKKDYGDPVVFITENGYSSKQEIEDHCRVSFYNSYLGEVLKAIYDDGVKVKMYLAWSLLDSFEWIDGYGVTLGVVNVNREDPNKTRTIKESGKFLAKVFSSRKIDPSIAAL